MYIISLIILKVIDENLAYTKIKLNVPDWHFFNTL